MEAFNVFYVGWANAEWFIWGHRSIWYGSYIAYACMHTYIHTFTYIHHWILACPVVLSPLVTRRMRMSEQWDSRPFFSIDYAVTTNLQKNPIYLWRMINCWVKLRCKRHTCEVISIHTSRVNMERLFLFKRIRNNLCLVAMNVW